MAPEGDGEYHAKDQEQEYHKANQQDAKSG